jgi:transposase
MYTKQEIIIKSHREGKSQRQISTELQINRRTVKRYLQDYDRLVSTTKDTSMAQITYLSTEPVYKNSNRGKVRLTNEVQQEIDLLLDENQKKKTQGLGKQLLKKHDILETLHENGIQIGYTSVCNYIRSKEQKKTQSEAFIRQQYLPGESCEFDWGEIKLNISGKLCRLYLAVFTSAYSNYRYAQVYQRQDSLAFMESHVSFFSFIDGVYHNMVYDNMRVAVARFVGPHEKEPTRALTDMKAHYRFSHRFCNAYRGNEKGHVERSVEYVRRKAFAKRDSFTDLDQAAEHLQICLLKINGTLQQLTGKTALELFETEKEALWNAPAPLVCSEVMQLRVDKYVTVSFKGNRYSVPDHLVGKFVDAIIYCDKIEFYHENFRVAVHPRNYGKQQWIINIEHYLHTFKKKPGALAGSVALASNSYLKDLYLKYYTNSSRDFIDLLHFCKERSITNERIEESVTRLLSSCPEGISTEKLTAILGNKPFTQAWVQPLSDETTFKSKEQLRETASLFW